MLVDEDGTLLKPIKELPRGAREVQLYKTVFDDNADSVTLQLRTFVPKYFGTIVKPNIATSFQKNILFPDHGKSS